MHDVADIAMYKYNKTEILITKNTIFITQATTILSDEIYLFIHWISSIG